MYMYSNITTVRNEQDEMVSIIYKLYNTAHSYLNFFTFSIPSQNHKSYCRGVLIFLVLVAELGGSTGLGVGVYEVTEGVVDLGEGRVDGEVGDTVTKVVEPLCSLSMVLKW